jgi:hypothetical protein
MGGDPRPETNHPPNLLTLCAYHHAMVERYREFAYDDGLLVHQSQDPAVIPVKTWRGWVLLAPDGTETPHKRRRTDALASP